MRYATLMLFIVVMEVYWLPVQSQNQQKIDSILTLIKEALVDTTKAGYYLELSDLTMYSNQSKTLEYLNMAESLLQGTGNLKSQARFHSQKANYYYRLGEIDSARYHLASSVSNSLQISDTLQAAVIRHNIGILDHYQGNTENANKIMNQNIPIFEQYHDSLHLGNAFLLKGKIGMTDGFFNIALSETYKALKIHRKLKDDFRIAEDLLQIGIIYQTTGEDEKAINIFSESIMHYERINSDQSIAQTLNYMADSKIKLGQFESAVGDLEMAMDLSQKTEYTANIARVYYNHGILNYSRKNYSDAIKNLKLSLETWKSVGSPNNEANAFYYLGRCYLMTEKYTVAVGYFDKAIEIALSLQDPEILSKVYLEKSVALEALEQHEAALDYFKKNKSLSDSIFTIKRTQATLELKTIYETEKKEQQLAIQKQAIMVLEQEASISYLQRLLLGIGLLLSISGFYALIQKMKRNKLEKEKVEADLAFKKKELTTHALHLAKKNEVLEKVKQKAKDLKLNESKQGYQQLIQTINFDQHDDKNWENFTQYFEQVHKNFSFNVKAKYPEITPNELRLLALLKMNLSSKEIANILNISGEGIKKARYRLRKKLNISSDTSLQEIALEL